MRAFLVYGLYRVTAALARLIPSGVADRCAGAAGGLLFLLSPKLRRALMHNMRHVLGPAAPEAQVRAHARRICGHLIRNYYDQFRVDRLSADEINSRGRVEGWEHLHQAVAQGRGVITIAPHLGNVDFVLQIPAVHGLPMTAVAEHIQPERLYRYVLRQRTSHGLKLIPSDGPMLSLFRALKRGEMIGLACDRVVSHNENGRVTDLFGAPALLPAGPVQLALRTGALLLPVHALRLPDHRFLVRIDPAIELSRRGDDEADLAAGMERLASVLEGWIGPHPDQWLVTVPVWARNVPGGERSGL